MLNNCVAVLNIGSSNVSLIVGEESVNGTFTFRAKESEEYYAFYGGEFFDVSNLKTVIEDVYARLKGKNDIASITGIFVSLPSEFTKTLSKKYKITFNKTKKITSQDVESFYNLGYEAVDGYTLVNRSEIYFNVNNVKTHTPTGFTSNSLAGRLSFVYASNYFKSTIDEILKGMGIKNVKYLSVDLAENLYLFKDEGKDVCRILVDVDCVTTGVSISSGNGLLYNSSASVGGGVLSGYISETYNCDYEVADVLKDKINLGLLDNPDAKYVITNRFDDEFAFSRNEINDIARNVLDDISEKIDKSLSACDLKIPNDVEVYFTGSGICGIRGAIEYVASRLNSYPNVAKPKIPHYDKPIYSALISLLYTTLLYKNDKIFFA
jgi:cell division ATPase FtsA